ncbi:MAG: DNA-processing protein DprA [Clostridiales bacterium]|nr:DNA-processing protein DprA [Clostridiales bacterium]
MYTLEEKICILFGKNNVSSNKFFQIWNLFDGAEDLLVNFGKSKYAETLLGDSFATLKKAIVKDEVDKIIADMQRHDVFAVTWFSPDYPKQLRNVDDKPYVLFCKGEVKLFKTDCLAVVGTRKVSAYGKRITKDFTRVLSEHFTVVSGLAYGVDSVAHETTLEEHGKTIAVLGGGLVNVYPAANQGLADRIVASGGLLVSEYGLYATPLPFNFPQRNRIVSGLSKGVLVCQSPAKSGTNSTVELALNQGRDVFVVPGEIYDVGFKGSNSLIKSIQGACVTTPRDIVDFYGLDVVAKERKTHQLSIDEQAVVNALTTGQLTFDELVFRTGIAPAELNFVLANLELSSIIVRLPGNIYRVYGGIE